jgi:hypothetical protein
MKSKKRRIPWRDWVAAGYSPRRLGDRRTLPLFPGSSG